uniref:Uncharacterized protein n=1 Tax=Opuntia streptacantha TaxID=393608 RepID=A0A7C8YMH1_OPUST
MTAKSRFLADNGCLETTPVLRLILTFSISAWTRSIRSNVCSADNMLGATITIVSFPFSSTSSHALMAWIMLYPGTSNHFISFSSLAYLGMTPTLDTFPGSKPTGDPPLKIISIGSIPIWMSGNIVYFFVIAKSCRNDGCSIEKMGTSACLFPLESNLK